MLVVIPAAREHLRLVHTEMDRPAGERRGKAPEHMVNERIHPLVAHQQNIIRVKMRPVFRPALDGVQMRQRLDAGHDRHTVLVGICVQFTQLGLRVASAHIAEVRLVRYLIGVFCV